MKFKLNQEIKTPTLSGEHIVLRPYQAQDFQWIKIYRQDEESCRYIRPPESDERIAEIVAENSRPWCWQENRWNGLVICEKNNLSRVIGEMIFKLNNFEQQRAELGYRINPQSAGRGVATSAAKLLINYLFEVAAIHKVVAKCDPRNIGSYRVMEKLGMVREAHFKQHFLIGDEWSDQVDYGVLKSDWNNRD